MGRAKLETHKAKLEEERKRLLDTIEAGKKHEDFGADVDLDEEADEAESFGTQLSIAQALKNRIAEIDSALNKMESGGFGKCENCKNSIEKEILDFSPASKLCAACKKSNR